MAKKANQADEKIPYHYGAATKIGWTPESGIEPVDGASHDVKADIDRVLEILRTLPMLRRYGDDENAMKEAREILERVKENL